MGNNTVLDLSPVVWILHTVLQPDGVISEAVFVVLSARRCPSSALAGDYEGKDCEEQEQKYDNEHEEQIEPEKPRYSVTCTYET